MLTPQLWLRLMDIQRRSGCWNATQRVASKQFILLAKIRFHASLLGPKPAQQPMMLETPVFAAEI